MPCAMTDLLSYITKVQCLSRLYTLPLILLAFYIYYCGCFLSSALTFVLLDTTLMTKNIALPSIHVHRSYRSGLELLATWLPLGLS